MLSPARSHSTPHHTQSPSVPREAPHRAIYGTIGRPLERSCLSHSKQSDSVGSGLQPVSQFSRSVVSDSFRPHESQYTRPPCPSPTPSSLKLTSIESVMRSSHPILCRPLLLPPSTPPSFRIFSNEPTLRMTWPKYWSCSFSIRPSSEHPGLTSFRMDRLDLLAALLHLTEQAVRLCRVRTQAHKCSC